MELNIKLLFISALFFVASLIPSNSHASAISVGSSPYSIVSYENKVFVGDSGGVTIINTDTYQVTSTVSLVGAYPPTRLLNVGDKICVLDQEEDVVTVISGKTGDKIATIQLDGDSEPYYAAAYANKLFVPDFGDNTMSIINLDVIPSETDAEELITGPIGLITVEDVNNTPLYPLVVGDKVFVNHISSNRIIVFNAKTNARLASLVRSSSPALFGGIAIGDKLYFTSNNSSVPLVIVDTKEINYSTSPTTDQTGNIFDTISVNTTSGTIKPLGGNYLVVTDWVSNPTTASIVEVQTKAVTTASLNADNCEVVFSNGAKGYITSPSSNKIFIVDAANIALSQSILSATITGEGSPTKAVLVKNKLFISNTSHGTVSVLNIDTNTFVDVSSLPPVLNSFNKY